MSNEFDAYREALVVETNTLWPDEVAPPEDGAARRSVEDSLHAAPQQAAELTYERLHTGFCRVITVTAGDLARVTGR